MVHAHARNVNDCRAFDPLLHGGYERPRRLGWTHRLRLLVADRGYDSARIRRRYRRYGLTPVIPKRVLGNGHKRRNPEFDAAAYRGRNVVERCLGLLKECRRVATRYEKLASSYLAMLILAGIWRLVKKLCKTKDRA